MLIINNVEIEVPLKYLSNFWRTLCEIDLILPWSTDCVLFFTVGATKFKITGNIKKKIFENENPEKIVNTVEKILNFDNQQKGKGRSRMLASRPSDLVHIAKVSDYSNISNY